MTKLKLKLAAVGAACAAVTTVAVGDAHAVTVPNMYHCSYKTQQCWQTNPPHVASIINRCSWFNDNVYNAAWASSTCDKYTQR